MKIGRVVVSLGYQHKIVGFRPGWIESAGSAVEPGSPLVTIDNAFNSSRCEQGKSHVILKLTNLRIGEQEIGVAAWESSPDKTRIRTPVFF